MNKPGTPQLATIASSQLTTIAGGIIDPIIPIVRLPDPDRWRGGWFSSGNTSPPRPWNHPSTPPWPSHSAIPSVLPYHPVGIGAGSRSPGHGDATHHYYGV